MNKKLITAAGAGVLLLAMAAPTFACMGRRCRRPKPVMTVRNKAKVKTNTTTVANTGGNNVGGMMVMGAKVKTGNAGASSSVLTDVNYTSVDCNCLHRGRLHVNNKAKVKTNTTTVANTGGNSAGGMLVGCSRVRSGDAGASSMVTTLANTTMVGGVAQ